MSKNYLLINHSSLALSLSLTLRFSKTHVKEMIIVLVGSVYEDLLVKVQRYPKEDVKTSAIELEKRPGGNSYNTALQLTKEGVEKIMLITAVSSQASSKYLFVPTGRVIELEECWKL